MITFFALWLLLSFPFASLLGAMLRPTADEVARGWREDVSCLDSVTTKEGAVR